MLLHDPTTLWSPALSPPEPQINRIAHKIRTFKHPLRQINQEYLQPLVEVVQNYKDDILDEFLLLTGDAIAVTKVDATQNKASKFAKEVRGMVVRGEDVPSCIGDFELFHAVIEGHRIWG